ncbi:metallophosphoesterase [Gemmata sp.]|uniref:metallophosphoesterase n=1 Tax=Gemmata sp. TaxID=1914242 RepID=UPI003F703483
MFETDRRAFLTRAALAPLAPLGAALARGDAPDPYADARLIDGEPPAPAAGSFTVAVLPDTQHYSEKYPATFLAQTDWIAKERKSRNIAFALHLGDVTNRNTAAEWRTAAGALAALDEGGVPYAFCPGNHDYSEGGLCKDRTTLLNEHLPVKLFKSRPTFGGTYDKEPDRMENSFHLFTAGGRDFLVLALEFGPRADVLRWANAVARQHATRETILITHALIFHDDTRYNWKKFGTEQRWNPHAYPVAKATADDVSDGEELWDRLVSKHENFVLTLNGHVLVDGLGRVTTATPGGRAVPQVLVNFQMRPKGGDGWLRLLEFKADKKTVEVVDYSPVRKQRNESPQNRFTLELAAVAPPAKK